MNAQIKITYRDKVGNEILNPTDGQLGYSSETSRLYKWSAAADEWQLVDGDISLGMNTYDLNKQIIAQMGIFEAPHSTATLARVNLSKIAASPRCTKLPLITATI